MGELIVPITFKKCVLSNGVLKCEEFEVRGRNTPLREIRRTLYKKHKSLYRVQSDDEIDAMSQSEIIDYLKYINEFKNNENEFENNYEYQTSLKDQLKYYQRHRHLAIWHDGSTVSNHSHVLFTCTEMYDKAFHLTNEEALQKFGKEIDVQETIETPEIYIFSRCHGNTEMYRSLGQLGPKIDVFGCVCP